MYINMYSWGTCPVGMQGSEPVRALGIRNSNALPNKPPAGPAKAVAGKRAAPTGAKSHAAGAAVSSGPADDDDAGLAAGILSKAEAEGKLLEIFGEGTNAHTYALHGLLLGNWTCLTEIAAA